MKYRLWTKNFTILTVGSLISMMGNSVSNFALGLLVYGQTNSTFLYSIYVVVSTLPKIFVPMLIGPYVDRSSRKKIIVTVDTIYGFLFTIVAFMTYMNFYHYILYLGLAIILGTLDSIYNVAYESFYPELITEGNFSKAYSISSMMNPIATTIMVPIAGFAYDNIGIAPLLLFNAVTFFITQGMERLLNVDESQLRNKHENKKESKTNYKEDFIEGIKYLKEEKGLLCITTVFVSMMLVGDGFYTILLPFFSSSNAHTVTQYSLVMSISTLGRVIGAAFHYRYRFPADKKFAIAIIVYFIVSLIQGSAMLFTFPVMAVLFLIMGMVSVTSFNIRISGTQSYVPSEKRGRFNGLFMMATMTGSIIGKLIVGILGEFINLQYIAVGLGIINILAIVIFMIPHKDDVKKVYNQSI